MDETVDTLEEAVLTTNRLSMNQLSMNRLSMNGLSSSRLSTDGLTLATTPLLSDDAGRELLRYVVRCALPEGWTLVGKSASITYTFEGLIGLVPEWLYRPLSEKNQRWMSACLLAHVNGYGVEVPISLRGSDPALATSEAERNAYTSEEISFFGNVFMPVGRSDELGDSGQRMYSCGGPSLRQVCLGSAFQPMRTCATALDCPLQFIGPCQAAPNDSDGKGNVCKRAAADTYIKCRSAQLDSDGDWSRGKTYKEVITVYLQQTELKFLYPSCAL